MANNQEAKKCPYCAEELLQDAAKCPHCGSDIPTVTSDTQITSSAIGIEHSKVSTDATKYVNVALLVIIAALLSAITYSTGLGKLFPQKEPLHITCDSLLTQNLLYSSLIGEDKSNNDLQATAAKIKDASSIEEINQLLADNTNINAARTEFYSSLSNAGDCKAHVWLSNPDKEGNTSMYVSYAIDGFAPTVITNRSEGEIVEQIHVDFMGIDKQKE